jgi:hypothetical protein
VRDKDTESLDLYEAEVLGIVVLGIVVLGIVDI